MSLILSAQTGTKVTPAMLLGTEAEEKKAEISEGQRKAERMLKKMKKAGLLPPSSGA